MPITQGLKNYSNVHFTDASVAASVVKHFKPVLPCLEPCRGSGAFFRRMPSGTDWCELSQGRDFFQYKRRVRWIVTNPPFEKLTDWMQHAFQLSENVVFVIPLSKFFSSAPRIELAQEYGWAREVLYLGRGRSMGFDIGFPFGAVHFVRGYAGPTTFTWKVEPK